MSSPLARHATPVRDDLRRLHTPSPANLRRNVVPTSPPRNSRTGRLAAPSHPFARIHLPQCRPHYPATQLRTGRLAAAFTPLRPPTCAAMSSLLPCRRSPPGSCQTGSPCFGLSPCTMCAKASLLSCCRGGVAVYDGPVRKRLRYQGHDY